MIGLSRKNKSRPGLPGLCELFLGFGIFVIFELAFKQLQSWHKAYTGPAIQMRIYDRSIELWNYGLLPKELTPAALLQKHSSYPRNHNIANVFYKAGFVESWGRGFKKIAEEFERASLPLPTIEENGGGVMAIIQRKTIDEVIAERGGDVGVNVGDMSETMSVTQRTIERDLSVLQKAGIIRHEGRANAGVWVILEQGNTNS
ncbi:ATP-binding protein [Segatella hominis]|uniref:DeoR family transcriptional regulator n=1 Tax=Segatella hominis TaxID=2518605 RepID=A0A4Y8USW7_9BACT|nr:ATP-binding protein [Segatella hominis]TFH70877.1 DeoR family transcriptional regulator [Segatella hominis]